MNKRKFILLFVIMLFPLLGFAEIKPNPIGIGIGAFYNGVGVSYRVKNENHYNYYSAGCPSFGHGQGSGFIINCGFGYSLLATNIIKGNHHGIVGNIGVTYVNYAATTRISYLAGISYAYFFSGIENSGWNIQAGPIFEYFDNQYYPAGIFGFGYQY